MITLLKNEFERIKYKKAVLVIAFLVMPFLIAVAICFSGRSASKETIAFLSREAVPAVQSDQYDVTAVEEAPALSQLIGGEYAAFVTGEEDGGYTVESLKSGEDKAAIKTLFQTGRLPAGYESEDQKRQERGVGTNILGFITMLALMQGVALTMLYPEDRLNRTFCRIMISPVSVKKYLSAQLIFTMLCLYLPTFAAICVIHFVFGAAIGYSLGVIALLLLILTLFATAFALFISSLLDRDTNLVTTGISIVTCILAGCFVPILTNHFGWSVLCRLIPQSSYMNLVHGMEFGGHFCQYSGSLTYLFFWIGLLFLMGIMITKKKIEKGIY